MKKLVLPAAVMVVPPSMLLAYPIFKLAKKLVERE